MLTGSVGRTVEGKSHTATLLATCQSKHKSTGQVVSDSTAVPIFYPISLFITVGREKGQQYSLGTGPLTLHSKKENMGNQMRARRLCW